MSSKFDNKMVYAEVEKMSSLFLQAATHLEETVKKMGEIANQLQDTTLQGKAGAALVETINTDLVGSLNRFKDKMKEMSDDLKRDIEEQKSFDKDQANKIK